MNVGFQSGDAVGLAICKGAYLGNPRNAWQARCARHLACPTCEAKRSAKKAHQVKERLKVAEYYLEDDLTVGVLTTTLPGEAHASKVRYGSLREQYDYFIKRTTLPGLTGWHSMRGLNKLIVDLGAWGGTHFIEFTWNGKKSWWNLHCHSLLYGPDKLDRLKETSLYSIVPDQLLLQKSNRGKTSVAFSKLGFGPRYTLDYAEDHELDSILKYSSKVAYATKPFKAPKSKFTEIRDFLDSNPRLSRPFGQNANKPDSLPDF